MLLVQDDENRDSPVSKFSKASRGTMTLVSKHELVLGILQCNIFGSIRGWIIEIIQVYTGADRSGK